MGFEKAFEPAEPGTSEDAEGELVGEKALSSQGGERVF